MSEAPFATAKTPKRLSAFNFGEWTICGMDKVQSFQKEDRNAGAPRRPAPEPVMDQNGARGRVPVKRGAIADERKGNDEKIVLVRVSAIEPGVSKLNAIIEENARRVKVLRVLIDDRQAGSRKETLENQGGARKEAAANDPDGAHAGPGGDESGQRARVSLQDPALEELGA